MGSRCEVVGEQCSTFIPFTFVGELKHLWREEAVSKKGRLFCQHWARAVLWKELLWWVVVLVEAGQLYECYYLFWTSQTLCFWPTRHQLLLISISFPSIYSFNGVSDCCIFPLANLFMSTIGLVNLYWDCWLCKQWLLGKLRALALLISR